ncbi:hypothetical protein ACFWF7_08440 [Nocardia sp. NPDC060256]|uniref:hypothetical protein n=1 Tax=unclassified Nocardia TaxID=2637762 RepID=UPI003661370E
MILAVAVTTAFWLAAMTFYWWAFQYQQPQGWLRTETLQTQALNQLGHLTGHPPDAVDCEGPLHKKTGSTVHCFAHYGTGTAGFTAIASDVDQDSGACRISIMADRPYSPEAK